MYLYAIAAFLLSWGLNLLLIRYLRKRSIMDIPNERSSHTIPTPRGGGRAIMFTVIIMMIATVLRNEYFLPFSDEDGVTFKRAIVLIGLSALMGILGWLDDSLKGISAGIRFAAQIGIACIAIYYIGPMQYLPLPSPGNVSLPLWLGWIVSIVWIVGITNIFNFLDGINGYAGLQGFIAAMACFVMSFQVFDGEVILASIILAFACLGFLMVNWNKAKIFMGDVGSNFIGFLLAALPFFFQNSSVDVDLHSNEEGLFSNNPISNPFLLVLFFLWFFLSDGIFTMIRRLTKGEKIWTPHRSHLYQRLTIAGYSHAQVATMMGIMYVILLLVLFGVEFSQPSGALNSSAHWLTLAVALLLFCFMLALTHWKEAQFKKTKALADNEA